MAEIRTVEQYVVAQKIQPRVAQIVRDLRGLADDIEQEAQGLALVGTGDRTYIQVVSAITQRIANALPALQLGPLAQYAAEADVARAKED